MIKKNSTNLSTTKATSMISFRCPAELAKAFRDANKNVTNAMIALLEKSLYGDVVEAPEVSIINSTKANCSMCGNFGVLSGGYCDSCNNKREAMRNR